MGMTTQLIFGAVGLLAALLFFAAREGGTVTGEAARALVTQKGALLLDVRSPEEFLAGHLDGATNIPVEELGARLTSLPARKDQSVVVYCRSGRRSANAAGILKRAGYTRVFNLGAMSNWK